MVVSSRLDIDVDESMLPRSSVSSGFVAKSNDLVIGALNEGAIELSVLGPTCSESSLHGSA